MKKLLIASLLFFTGTVFAQHHHHHYHPHWRYVHNHGWKWVAPAVIGGVVVYEITRPPVVVQQPPVPPIVLDPPVVVQQQNCGPWVETKTEDGKVIISRTCQ